MALQTSNLNAFLTPLILIKSSLIGFVHNFFTHSKTLVYKTRVLIYIRLIIFLSIFAVIAVNVVKTYEIQGYINLTAFVGYQNADKNTCSSQTL